ncbi:MAG TPA: HAD family hydrolase [Bacteroidales bacterium]|nr:HAD family hydrolase [Bacteroidales bacterium]
MKFKGAIFDLDGTLVNSLEDLADSMNAVLKSNNFPVHDLSSYKYFVGNGLRNLVYKTLPEDSRTEETVNICYDSMVSGYRENCINKTQPYDGITDLLDELASRGIKLAVFSNKADELTKKIVQTLLPNCNFEVVSGLLNEEYKKPNPAGALKICETFGLQPADVVYIGDTGTDMKTSVNAGTYPAGALWGFRTKEELIANGAKQLLNHPLDLLQIL